MRGVILSLLMLTTCQAFGAAEIFIKTNQPAKALGAKVNWTTESWCEWKAESDRVLADIETDTYGFQVKKGPLIDNIETFLKAFAPNYDGMVSKIGMHIMPSDICIVEDSPEKIAQRMVEPFFVDQRPVYIASFINGYHAVFYKGDPEFVRYFVGVRK